MDKLPTLQSVTVGGVRLKVVVVTSEDWGGYRHDDRVIEVSERASRSRKVFLETLRHEMVHAALQIGGPVFSERYDEECVVRCLETIFFPAWERLQKRL